MILLIRHAMVDAYGRFLPGRMPDIHLNEEGRRQARTLGTTLRSLRIAATYSSPLDRARETAVAIAEGSGPPSIVPELNEIDFGEWTGLSFDELGRRADWMAFNQHRARSPIPGGEWMLNVQMRACRALGRLHRAHRNETIAVVSHSDVLRAVIAKVMEAPLDRLDAFRIDPASVSVLEPTESGFEITQLNNHSYAISSARDESRSDRHEGVSLDRAG
jgi:broad specificity phosphatase PhoE